ncbi:PD-(D/E)XK nuclease family protein [Candidatus Woesearchaeota archaeon]|nr:PD-(D/E)XK nuclease family protein [Candidatus Woesearchaeota archaeon]
MSIMVQRVQSPSSINTFKQCPRKYYYQYILGLQKKVPSIHLTRGKIVHLALEDFFKIDILKISEEYYEFELKVVLNSLFNQKWQDFSEELRKIKLTPEQLDFYYEESIQMLNNWYGNFLRKLNPKIKEMSIESAFSILKPMTEVHFVSPEFQVQGFVDAVHNIDGKVSLMDYKTSAKELITQEYKLQLAIYALLYEEQHGKKPNIVGIDFLKHKPHYLEVNDELIDFAKNECRSIQEKTISEDIEDYPLKTS